MGVNRWSDALVKSSEICVRRNIITTVVKYHVLIRLQVQQTFACIHASWRRDPHISYTVKFRTVDDA